MESCTQYITNDIVFMIMSCCLFSNMCWILMSSKSFTSYHSLHLYLQEDIISDTASSLTSKQHYNLIKTTSSTMTEQAASMSFGTHYPKEICGWSLNQLGKMGKTNQDNIRFLCKEVNGLIKMHVHRRVALSQIRKWDLIRDLSTCT